MDRKFVGSVSVSFLISSVLIVICIKTPAQGSDNQIVKDYKDKILSRNAELDSIQNELKRGRDRIEELRDKEGKSLEKKKLLEENINNSKTYMENLTERISYLESSIAMLEDSLDLAEERLEYRQDKMMERLRNMYKSGWYKSYEKVVTASSIKEAMYKLNYFRKLNRYDRILLESITKTKEEIKKKKMMIASEKEEHLVLLNEKKEEIERFKRDKKQREELLEEIKEEKQAYEKMVEQLEESKKELNLIVKQLEEKREKAEIEMKRAEKYTFSRRKGSLIWPVSGSIVKDYGKVVHPRFKTVTINSGIDIKSDLNSDVVCVAPGSVDYIGNMRGYGRFVIVNHYNGYMTIYAHLEDILIKEGDDVKLGQKLATVGKGSQGDQASLHFQIRKSTETVNPTEWLESKE
ncbi:MAG: murein hydrolase activator EnvC family protein [Chitinivibrionales bacterium]